MVDPQTNKEKIAISNRVKLPFAASWGEHILPAGEYDVVFMEAAPLPLVIVIGMDTVAMIAPARVEACEKAAVNTLLFSPDQQPPQVQLLRLATLQLDLRFEEGVAASAHPGVLALPLRLDARALAAAI